MKLSFKFILLYLVKQGIIKVKFLLLVPKLASSFAAPSNDKELSHSSRRDLQVTCTGGLVLNACANCCGYQFITRNDLDNAVTAYIVNKAAAIITYGVINCWDVSSITDMSYLFDSKSLNEPIGCWNVGSVTYMYYMFYGATNFNQPIGNWNVGSVTNMYYMFYEATNFNQPIGNWNVGKVTNMEAMFYGATNFNQNLCAWNNKVPSTTTFTYQTDDATYPIFDETSCPNKAIPDLQVKASFCQACAKPSQKPSAKPSQKPSAKPSQKPSAKPSQKPSAKPSQKPPKPIPTAPVPSPATAPKPIPTALLPKPSAPKTNNGGVQGDPHFKTWHGNHFSYHGECDLVLMKNDQFSDGEGLLIHVRTKIEKTWSYVKNAAVKIGNDILEIEGKGQVWDKSADAVHIINGEVNADLPLLLATKFPVTKIEEKQCDTHGEKCIEAIVYKIDLGGGDNILITQKWGVIKVSVTANDKDKFQDSIGLMGHFDKPGFLGRDGIHKITDFNQFGQEWQVLQSEPMIFNERRAPQHPEQCTLPTLTTKRRLGEDVALFHMAEEACAGVEEESKEFCIFDVTAAGTKEAASTYFTAYVG